MEEPEVQTRLQQHLDRQQQPRPDGRSPSEGSIQCKRKKRQLLPPNEIVACSDTNTTDGDGLRSSPAEFLYGRPTSSSLVEAGIEKYACWGKLRRGNKRPNPALQSSSLLPESLKWGAKKVRSAAQSSWPANDTRLEMPDGNSLITPASSDCEGHSQLNPRGRGRRPRPRQARCPTRPQDSEGNSCIPKMISSESTPMVARMETWSNTPPQVPSGPITPVPNTQKRGQKRKSLQSLNDVHPVCPNVGSGQEFMLETLGSRVLEPGSLSVVLQVRRELFSSENQKVAPTLSPVAESPTAPEKVQVQAGEMADSVLERGHEGTQIDRPVADCGRMLGWNGLSADRESISCYGTGYPNGVHILQDAVTHIQQHQCNAYLQGVIPPIAAQDNGHSYQLEGNDMSDTFTVASDLDPSTPLKFSIPHRQRPKLQVRQSTEFRSIGNLSTGCLRGEGAALRRVENAETGLFPPGSRRGQQKACFDLNKPASQSNEERPDFLSEKTPDSDPDFLAEKAPDSDKKVSRKKHPRPRVLKDVTKPVRVPKPKKASNVRKAQSTKPKRKKNTNSQDAQMRQPDVSPSYNCYEEQVETRVSDQLPGEDSLEAISKPSRMKAAARERSSFSLQTLEGESIVPVGIADLRLVDALSSAIVVHSSARRAIVPYAKPRVKPFKPKVQLGNDDVQWWKLVMTHGPTYQDNNDEATANKWARERFVFRARADKFIQVMHEVQGNRRFSKWKGSIIDSVVGAFLTQNVSDHLSSSAFMLLASRFPVSRDNIFREVQVEETFESMESHTDATPLRTKHADTNYLVELAEESTTAEGHSGEEPPPVEIASTVEELEKEHAEFWGPEQSSPEQSIHHSQTLMKSQHQADHTGSNDVSGESSGCFKILAGLQPEDGNPLKSSLLQEVEDNDASIYDGPEVSTIENPLIDEVQNTISSQFPSDRISSIQLPSDSASSVEATVVKVSYNRLTGSERARVEENKTKSKDKVDWEKVRKSYPPKEPSEEAFPSSLEDAVDWEAVRVSDVDQISSVIKERGMNYMLAGRIKGFLNRLQIYHGNLSLEWLRDLPSEEAKKFLLSIHGLGLKSAECIRLLTLHHLAFPVDTNVGRICVRLGWVPIEPLPEVQLLSELETYPVQANIQKYLWPRLCTLDQRTLYELHYQMITFGKVFCTKRDPNCNACPLRNECKHYADSVSRSRRLEIASTAHCEPSTSHPERLALPAAAESVRKVDQHNFACEPIIEEPKSPSRDPEACEEPVERTVPETSMQPYEEPSHALVIVSPDVAAKPVPKLKRVGRLRTVHYVYELKDDHPLINRIGTRVADDPCPVLLAIWGPGESPDTDVTSNDDSQQSKVPETVLDKEDTVKGTLLVPCRTANRGNFPLNGTYFQVNEVFADHETSINPIDVPRRLLWNLTRRFVYFGTSVTSIFKGLTVNEISHAFHYGYVCVRGFDSVTRAPKPLQPRLHSTVNLDNKRKQKQQEQPENNEEEDDYVNKASNEAEPNEKKQSLKIIDKAVV